MAHRLTSPRGSYLPHIWNVSRPVGDTLRSPNQPGDVNLVKYFLTCILSNGHGDPSHPGLLGALAEDGRFDTALGYRIFRYQRVMKQRFPDGVVSPARATADALDTWMIGWLNLTMYRKSRPLWENLPDAPGLDPLLRYELSTARL